MQSDVKSEFSLKYICASHGRDSSHVQRLRDSFLTGMFVHAIN